MTNEIEYFYLGHFMPEDSEELISIVRSSDRTKYEYWNELFSEWKELKNDSFGERLFTTQDLTQHGQERFFLRHFHKEI